MLFNLFGKGKSENPPPPENKPQGGTSNIAGSMTGTEFLHKFMEQYAPYTLKDYTIKERTFEELPDLDKIHPGLRSMAHQVDLRRAEDPMIGAKMAAKEIHMNLVSWLKDDKGIQSEMLLAALASVGGRVCVQGLMQTLDNMIATGIPDRKKLLYSIASLLQLMIVETKSGEAYIMGDRIGNEFMLFYSNSIGEKADMQKLLPIAKKTAECCGSETYWKTPYASLISPTPQVIADTFTGRFEPSFQVYCRFPQERMLAAAFAAQMAFRETVSQNVLDKEKAASIIAEYGWRASHYWGKF